METLYDILEVSRKASKEVIEKAYKTLAKKYHPDLQTEENKVHAEAMMKKINDAYEILSDDEKRSKYDRELEEKEEQERNNLNNNVNMNNVTSNNEYYNAYTQKNNEYSERNNKNIDENDWREQFSKLSKKQQEKLIKNIQKEASAEYRKLYVDYFRSLGFKIKRKWTFKDFLAIFILILILCLIIFILWLIPPTHELLLELYESNLFIRIIVNITIGIFQGIINFFKNITNY